MEPVAEDPEKVHERRPRSLRRPQADRGGERSRPGDLVGAARRHSGDRRLDHRRPGRGPRAQLLPGARQRLDLHDRRHEDDDRPARGRRWTQDPDPRFRRPSAVAGRGALAVHFGQVPGRDDAFHLAVRVRPDHEVPQCRSGGERVGRFRLHDRRIRPLGGFERVRREPYDGPAHRCLPRAEQPSVDAQPHGRGDRRRGHSEQERRPRRAQEHREGLHVVLLDRLPEHPLGPRPPSQGRGESEEEGVHRARAPQLSRERRRDEGSRGGDVGPFLPPRRQSARRGP